ncbi:MAG: hypothetical protein MUF71_08625 [Candidatus Kapabacteria bacterium]|nr:hypothetical protein [Candidatus Kapabacteria bacterium]
MKKAAYNTGLAKVVVPFSADTFVVKIAIFAKPETVSFPHAPLHKKALYARLYLACRVFQFRGQFRENGLE